MSNPMYKYLSNYKLVDTKNLKTLYHYEYPILRNRFFIKDSSYKNLGRKTAGTYKFDLVKYLENKKRTSHKAKAKIIDYVNANLEKKSKFLTLTFAENVSDVDYCNYELTKFLKKLNYYIFKSKKNMLKYIAVIEFQERGAIHYHIIIFNLPYIKQKKIAEIWGHGFIFINRIAGQHKNIANYLTKYITKSDNNLLGFGRKSHIMSRNLTKPTYYEYYSDIKGKLDNVSIVGETEYISHYYGKVSVYYYK